MNVKLFTNLTELEKENTKYISDFPENISDLEANLALRIKTIQAGNDVSAYFKDKLYSMDKKVVIVEKKLKSVKVYRVLDAKRSNLLLKDVASLGNFPTSHGSPFMIAPTGDYKGDMTLTTKGKEIFSAMGRLTVSVNCALVFSAYPDILSEHLSELNKDQKHLELQFVVLINHII